MTALSIVYLISALFCFAAWFNVFRQDTDLSPAQKRMSIKILIVATLLWPIVVPISCLEKRSKRQQSLEQLQEVEMSTAVSSDAVTLVASREASSDPISDTVARMPNSEKSGLVIL